MIKFTRMTINVGKPAFFDMPKPSLIDRLFTK
jgi:hypothetical protein